MNEGAAVLRRQRLENQNPNVIIMSEGAELSDQEDEEEPLTGARSTKGRSPGDVRRRLTAKLKDFIADKEEEVSCLGSIWRLIASVILTLVLASPFLFSFYKYAQLPMPTYPSDLETCAIENNFSFALLHRQIERSFNYCPGNFTKQSCHCSNPFKPVAKVATSPDYFLKWDSTFKRNIQLAESFADEKQLRVALYGDSITEHWLGTDLGVQTQEAMSVNQQFQSIFNDGAVALGLAGDRCPQLLYRLENGELPDSLQPPVIWLLIGTNDLADNCSEESILIGILNIARLLQNKRPDSHIVLNGILPKPHPSTRVWDESIHGYQDIQWINERLACYAQGMASVEYFDPTPIFVEDESASVVPADLMPDGVHPSAKGARQWGEAISQRVDEIIQEMQFRGSQTKENNE